jgi:uncharacterized SAM-binding protein YcdF (DUF218 family)
MVGLGVDHGGPPVKADTIVLLGGEWVYRPKHTLELYEQQLAPDIIVSGQGDANAIKRWLTAQGVPGSAIKVEGKSLNTMQNAEFTVPLLRERNARRVILVTSWFHSRRAVACFEKVARRSNSFPCRRWPTGQSRTGRIVTSARWSCANI